MLYVELATEHGICSLAIILTAGVARFFFLQTTIEPAGLRCNPQLYKMLFKYLQNAIPPQDSHLASARVARFLFTPPLPGKDGTTEMV